MKKSKILAPALAILCLSTAASVTGTVAWFAANNVVSATGMSVYSTLPSSLAISGDLPLPVGNATSVTLSTVSQALNPVSHWGADNEGVTIEGSGGTLYRVTNGEDVDPATGLALTGEELAFAVASGDTYYTDFTVYIGSVGQALTLGATGYLRAEVAFSGSTADTNMATTVDFHAFNGVIDGSGLGTYMGCVNAAEVDSVANHGAYDATPDDTYYVDVLSGANTIPVASSTSNALKITMRIYIDGALQNSGTTTYVATNTVVSEDIDISVQFSLNRG